jgi:hypothetical protein|tara:strand:- start:75 stop:284 length:210 start_codon:yes stop_codon:yes gene_type:complete
MLKEVIKTRRPIDALTEILLFVLVILVSTFVLRFTWNNSLVKHITVLKPITTFLDAFLLSVSLAVIRGI